MSKAQEAAKAALKELLNEFGRLADSGWLRGQAEAAARTWVERFLTVFGWNPSDPSQVRQEYRIQGRAARRLKAEGTTHRRPDYCLISNGERILYIDVKKFDANIESDSGIAYQIRCYGWSENFRVSYAFDFGELAVYDCRIGPKDTDEADIARVVYLRRENYLDHFETLWDLFSKEAVDHGSLSKIVSDEVRPRGMKTLDQAFEDNLTEWRKGLAKSILRYGRTRDAELISAAAQRILDRIIFLRICEEFGFEEMGSLLEMGQHEDGFWPLFLEEHEKRYSRVYDGILFPATGEADPTGVDRALRSWWLKGRVFREIVERLYHPHPYRFDVIPIELLGGIYERYLGKRLRVIGNDVTDEFKCEYQRTKGAVYTPLWVVRRVVKKTLGPLIEGRDPEAILGIRICDPACGSAGFLLGVYDELESRILDWFEKHPGDRRRSLMTAETADGRRLTSETARRVINGCLHGVDIDAEAVEIARMSLALKYLERTASFGGEPVDLLNGIGLNIKQGNSLVGPDIVGLGLDGERVIKETMPFDWENRSTGFGAVLAEGGFHAVVGNPPYIEVKRYKEWMPSQYAYLKEAGVYETTVQGKTDISMPFMERGLKLLRPEGRLGFIIQNRFFKTDYGEIARGWLRRRKAVAEIEDFGDLQVFPGRTTYTAILILQESSPAVHYKAFPDLPDAQGDRPSVRSLIPWDRIDEHVWSFDQPDLLEVHRDLVRRHGTIGQRPGLQISVGLQTLYGKLYQFEPVSVKPRTVVGRNGEGETVSLERAALRPLCRNRGFYPFRADNADAWVIFPYDVLEDTASEIPWSDFKTRFPKTAGYLEIRKKRILEAVEVEKGAERWHLYKYPKNLVAQTRPKVLFPMTIEDTAAAVDFSGDVYQDNVNINSMSLHKASKNQLKALAALINSSAFNCLARLKSGLNDAGWRKFNRQFAELVPFPGAILDDQALIGRLAKLADHITELQSKVVRKGPEGVTGAFRATLHSLWYRLDEEVEKAYALSRNQRDVLRKYPRRLDRFDLLLRQSVEPEED